MKSKTNFKKQLSIALACVMLVVVGISAYGGQKIAKADENIEMFTEGREYREEYSDDGKYILYVYENDIMIEQVIIDSSQIIAKTFIENEECDVTFDAEDVIKFSTDNAKQNRVGSYVPLVGNIGSVRYKASNMDVGNYFPVISFSSELVAKYENRDFDVTGGQGITLSVLIAAISYGLGGLAGAGLAQSILKFLNFITGDAIKNMGTVTITGAAYYYNITGSVPDGRTRIKSGETYFGSIKKDGIWLNNQMIHANYYPEFIIEQERYVAIWFFYDLFADPFNIEEYIPNV